MPVWEFPIKACFRPVWARVKTRALCNWEEATACGWERRGVDIVRDNGKQKRVELAAGLGPLVLLRKCYCQFCIGLQAHLLLLAGV